MLKTIADVKAAIGVVLAVTETIREAGSVPAGTLYAGLMTRGIDYQTFEKIVATITGAGLVAKRGDLLVWIGPELSEVVN